jgi:hypothetical protein
MPVTYQERPSDSTYAQTIWRTQVEKDGCDIVVADGSWDMIVSRHHGKTILTVWGPMTKAAQIPHLEGDEHLGICFRLGTFMPVMPASEWVDTGTVLPEAAGKSFWLDSSAWEYPTFDNVETFLDRLVRRGILARDSVVEDALKGNPGAISPRSVQRRFHRITGLTQRYLRSIDRARHAAALLRSGTTILDTVAQAGYADQQHMTRATKRFLGQTPAQMVCIRSDEQMSSQFKTVPCPCT